MSDGAWLLVAWVVFFVALGAYVVLGRRNLDGMATGPASSRWWIEAPGWWRVFYVLILGTAISLAGATVGWLRDGAVDWGLTLAGWVTISAIGSFIMLVVGPWWARGTRDR